MNRKTVALVAAPFLVFATTVGVLQANAAQEDKIVICHATGAEKNPYTSNSVDPSSVESTGGGYLNGHGNHGDDIIPPFTYGSVEFPGRNWDAQGQAIWNNGCKPAKVEPTPEPTVEPTPEPTVEPTPEPTVEPTPTVPPPPPPPPPGGEGTPTPTPATETPTEELPPPAGVVEEELPAVEEGQPLPAGEIIAEEEEVAETTSPAQTPPARTPVPTKIPAGGGGMVEMPTLKR
jgi:hypothetical protein